MHTSKATVFLALALAAPAVSRADEGWASVAVGGAKPIAGDQSRELGGGGILQLSLRHALGARIALQAQGTALALARGRPPSDPALTPRGNAGLLGGAVGIHVRPFGAPAGLWTDVNAGVVDTGGLVRPSGDAHVGYDFILGAAYALGPAVGFLYVPQSSSEVRPDAASIALVMIRLTGLGSAITPPALAPPRLERAPEEVAERDTDGDGISDARDRCPLVPEDRDGFEDDDGCPDPDNDHDGIADADDRCPNDPETRNGFEDEDGCPDDAPGMRVTEAEIVLDDRIQFDLDRATLKAVSLPLLGRLAALIAAHADLELVSIEGHADDLGSESYNQSLSERRAAAVRAELLRAGVAPERLSAIGFGESRPLVKPTLRGREKNRRVEFRVVRRGHAAESASATARLNRTVDGTSAPSAKGERK